MRTLLVVQQDVVQIDTDDLVTSTCDVLNGQSARQATKVTSSLHHSRFVFEVKVKAAVVPIARK